MKFALRFGEKRPWYFYALLVLGVIILAALIEYAKGIVNELRANMVRVESDFSATPFKAKIADAEKTRVHTMLVIGGRDMEAGAVSVRLHRGGPQGAKPKR